MSINLLIGEGRGNRIMVGQNHRRNPFISCRVYSAGETPCRDGRVALQILSPDDSVAHRGLSALRLMLMGHPAYIGHKTAFL